MSKHIEVTAIQEYTSNPQREKMLVIPQHYSFYNFEEKVRMVESHSMQPGSYLLVESYDEIKALIAAAEQDGKRLEIAAILESGMLANAAFRTDKNNDQSYWNIDVRDLTENALQCADALIAQSKETKP